MDCEGVGERCKTEGMTIGRVRPAILDMPSYRPGKAAEQIEQEQQLEDAIKLASNENPWSPIPEVADAIAAAISGVNRYGDNAGMQVREALSEWLGHAVDSITLGSGSSGLLQQLFFAYVDAGDEVVFPYPSFEVYPIFSRQFGATAVSVPLVDYAFDLDAVAAAVTDRTKLIFLATPNNPTGTSVSTGEISVLLSKIPKDVVVVVDEAYREFNDPDFGDPASLLTAHDNLVITRTFSKAFGLAGLRSGYAIAHPEIVDQLDKVRLPFSVNNLAQAAMLAALEHRDSAIERVEELNRERTRMVNELRSAGIELPDPQANFIFIPTGEDTMAYGEKMEQQGIAVRPFPDLGLRITIGTPAENDRWVAALLKILT